MADLTAIERVLVALEIKHGQSTIRVDERCLEVLALLLQLTRLRGDLSRCRGLFARALLLFVAVKPLRALASVFVAARTAARSPSHAH